MDSQAYSTQNVWGPNCVDDDHVQGAHEHHQHNGVARAALSQRLLMIWSIISITAMVVKHNCDGFEGGIARPAHATTPES